MSQAWKHHVAPDTLGRRYGESMRGILTYLFATNRRFIGLGGTVDILVKSAEGAGQLKYDCSESMI